MSFCKRAKQQWSTFENDIDYVVPLTIRSVDNLNAIPLGLSDMFIPEELAEEQDKDYDLYKIKTWLESGIKPSQKELSLSSPSVRYLWACESQLQVKMVYCTIYGKTIYIQDIYLLFQKDAT